MAVGGEQEAGAGGALEELGVLRVDLASAQRARGVSLEPAVNAVDMERVFAPRQQAEDVRVSEPRQADGALEAVPGSAQRREPE